MFTNNSAILATPQPIKSFAFVKPFLKNNLARALVIYNYYYYYCYCYCYCYYYYDYLIII